jgi:hypothetical protein
MALDPFEHLTRLTELFIPVLDGAAAALAACRNVAMFRDACIDTFKDPKGRERVQLALAWFFDSWELAAVGPVNFFRPTH